MCIGDCFICMYVHDSCVRQGDQERAGNGSPGTEITNTCESPMWCWEMNLSPLEGQSALLIAESSISPALFYLIWWFSWAGKDQPVSDWLFSAEITDTSLCAQLFTNGLVTNFLQSQVLMFMWENLTNWATAQTPLINYIITKFDKNPKGSLRIWEWELNLKIFKN